MKKLLFATTLTLSCLLAGCSSTKGVEQKTDVAINETATIDQVDQTITNVEYTNQLDEYMFAQEGSQFVIVTIRIENKSDEEYDYNALNYRMKNDQGQINNEYMYSIDNALNSGSLASQGSIEGRLIFEEPLDQTNLQILYYDNIFSDEVAMTFHLGEANE